MEFKAIDDGYVLNEIVGNLMFVPDDNCIKYELLSHGWL